MNEKRNAALRIGVAHYKLMARLDPDRAIRELGAPDSPNPNVAFFPEAVKDTLLGQAQGQLRAREVDAERDPVLAAQARKHAAAQAERAHFQAMLDGTPGAGAAIANDETLTPERRNRLLSATRRTLQPDPPATVANANAVAVLDRLRGGDGNA